MNKAAAFNDFDSGYRNPAEPFNINMNRQVFWLIPRSASSRHEDSDILRKLLESCLKFMMQQLPERGKMGNTATGIVPDSHRIPSGERIKRFSICASPEITAFGSPTPEAARLFHDGFQLRFTPQK